MDKRRRCYFNGNHVPRCEAEGERVRRKPKSKQVLLLLYTRELEGLKKAIEKGYASSRNMAIRDAIRVYLKELGLW